MVAIKNIAFAASCVASALAAPAEKRQDWGQMGAWGGQGQGQAQGQGAWGQGQNQGQAQGQGQAAGASSGSTAAPAGNSSSGSAEGQSAAGTTNLAAVSGETYTSSSSGQSGSNYYSHWVETNSGATMTVGEGSYSLEWTEASGNVVSGLGWNPASAK